MAGAICCCFITPACFTIVNIAYEIPSEDGALPAPPASTSFSVGSCNTPLAYAPPRHLQGIYGPIYRVLAIITTTGGGDSLPDHIFEWMFAAAGRLSWLEMGRIEGQPGEESVLRL